MKRGREFLVIMATLLVFGQLHAQYGRSADGPDGIYLVNYSGSTIKFQLSGDGVNWFTYTLAPNYYSTYAFDGQAFGYIRVSTAGGQTVKYKLSTHQRYQIKWNDTIDCWDVYIMTAQ